jgi:phasin family protein
MNPSTEHMQKSAQGMMQMCEEMSNYARESMDVAMRSMTAMTKGCDETVRSTGGLMQESMSRVMSASKTLLDAKSLQEMVNLHNELMKDCFDCWMTGAGRLSEISTRAAKEALEPVAQHANNAMGKMMQKARAH